MSLDTENHEMERIFEQKVTGCAYFFIKNHGADSSFNVKRHMAETVFEETFFT